MTIQEAEKRYELECKELELAHSKKCAKSMKFYKIFASILNTIGLVLIIVSVSLPLEKDFNGVLRKPFGATLMQIYAIIFFIIGIIVPLFGILATRKAKKVGPSYLSATKNLYLYYLKCTDMDKEDKFFYTQKLEEIRNSELVSAVRSAGAAVAASTFSAVMFTSLRK